MSDMTILFSMTRLSCFSIEYHVSIGQGIVNHFGDGNESRDCLRILVYVCALWQDLVLINVHCLFMEKYFIFLSSLCVELFIFIESLLHCYCYCCCCCYFVLYIFTVSLFWCSILVTLSHTSPFLFLFPGKISFSI